MPEKVELSGITFQGKQLSSAALEEAERRSEFMEARRKEIDGKVIILRRQHQKAKGMDPETKKVSGRLRRWTRNEIRKEYGLMKSPYPTKVENIIWCILNKGPIDLRGIADEIGGYKDFAQATRSLSGPLSAVWKTLGEKQPYGRGYMIRRIEANRYHYSMTPTGVDMSVEVLYEKYRKINNRILKDRKDRQNNEETGQDQPAPDKPLQVETEKWNDVTVAVGHAINEAASKTLGLQVQVTGQVKILFGFVREG